MMQTKELTDVISAAPVLSGVNDQLMLMSDANGNLGKALPSKFCRMTEYAIYRAGCLKITNIQTVLISMRSTLGGACSFTWVSTYGEGTVARTTHKNFYNYPAFSLYVNGDSEANASIYVESTIPNQVVSLYVIALDSFSPIITPIASIPADAPKIV